METLEQGMRDAFPPVLTNPHNWSVFHALWRVKTVHGIASTVYYMLVIVGLGWLGLQALDRSVPSKVVMTQLADSAPAGGKLPVQVDIFRNKICKATLSWTLRDGAMEIRSYGPIVTDSLSRPLGREAPFVRSFGIPRDAAPGEGVLSISREYKCPGNYVQGFLPIIVTQPDINFTITPADPKAPPPPPTYYKLSPQPLSFDGFWLPPA